jgi:hypothetical protein
VHHGGHSKPAAFIAGSIMLVLGRVFLVMIFAGGSEVIDLVKK